MATSIATQNPTFHAITGDEPVGSTKIIVRGDYANTITTVHHINVDYWTVTVRPVKDAFRKPQNGKSAQIWRDRDGSYVTDYWDRSAPVEAARSWDLRAALGVAISSAAERGHQDGLW